MPVMIRNVLAIVAGIVVGAAVNGGIVAFGPALIPPPAGVDVNSAAGLAKGIHLFEPRHFVVPFLAHAIGTFAGAIAAFLVAASHRRRFALAIGAVFLCGGVAASIMIPAPAWFIALDLLVAYLPMAWLGGLLGARLARGSGAAGTNPG